MAADRRVRLLPQAERELDEATLYLAEESSPETGIRFFDAAHETFRSLLEMPGMGKVREVQNPRLSGVRQWRVVGFESYLIFYRAVPEGIDVVRLLYGTRDLDHLLEETYPEE